MHTYIRILFDKAHHLVSAWSLSFRLPWASVSETRSLTSRLAFVEEQPHKIKLVVLGNHENNSSWNSRASEILSNATLLRQLGTAFWGWESWWMIHVQPIMVAILEI
jgi:hypothetical protein